MSPSLPSDPSPPSLSEMTPAREKEEGAVPSPSSTSVVSSDLSTGSSHGHADGEEAEEETEVLHPWVRQATKNVLADDSKVQWYYYLTPRAAERLPRYEYRGADTSLLYRYVLSPLAEWCVERFTPAWVAPNAITLFGLGWMIFSYLVIWYYCPGMYEANTDLGGAAADYAVPSVIFLLNAVAMLVYQTLDNMDGKQARRTGSSSPLGLLFDHGCDALNSALGSANWIAAMALVPGNVGDLPGGEGHASIQDKSLLSEMLGGDAVLAALLIVAPMVQFYFATWEHYHTGKLVLPLINGPSEGLAMGAMLSFVSFLWGPMYWQGTTWADAAVARWGWEGLEGRVRNADLIAVAALAGIAQEVALKAFSMVRAYGVKSLEVVAPNLLLAAATLAMVHFDPTILLRSPRCMLHLISGLFTEQTLQLMLDHMVDETFRPRDRWCLIPPVLAVALMAVGVPMSSHVVDTWLFVYTTGLWVYLCFKMGVQLFEIRDVLGIWILDITTPYPKEASGAVAGPKGASAGVVGTVPAADETAKKTN